MTADRTAALEAAQLLEYARKYAEKDDYFQRNGEASPIWEMAGFCRALLSTAKEADRMREALVKAEVALCAAEIVIDADDCVETFGLIQGTRRAVQAALNPSERTKG